MLIIGRYNGASGMSGLNICYIVYGLLTMSAVGFSFGGPILIAQQSGRRKYHLIRKTVRSLFFLAVAVSTAFGFAGFLCRDLLLQLVHTPSPVYTDARFYLSISCLTLLFFTVNSILYAVFRGLGNSKMPLLLVLFQSAVNILLDLILVGQFHYGLKGAAFAMLVSQFAAGILGSLLFLQLYKPFSFQKYGLEESSENMLSSILRISLPIILFGILMSVSALFINSNVNTYGASASAADGIGNQLKNLVSAISTGLYQGATIMVAQSFGKKDFQRIRQVFGRTILVGLSFCSFLVAVVVILPEQVFGLFTSDPSVISYAGNCLLIFAVSFAGLFLATGPFALLEGVGNTRLESVSGIIENFAVRILLGYLLGKAFGLYGYWLGGALASFVMPAVGYVYYRSGRWKTRNVSYPDNTHNSNE